MNAHARTFEFAPAIRERVSLIIALAGASGGGKTLSALKIARGLAGGDDSKIAFIDTEARRGLHYAVGPGEKPGPERFAFQHCDLQAPFTPEAYSDAIRAADETGRFEVIVVDSCSHEYEGEGGLHDMHDANVRDAVEKARKSHTGNYAFDEARTADRASVGAWNEPKSRHKRFVSRLLQCRAHLILCLRAEEKIRIEKVTEKGSNGREFTKTVIVQPKDMKPEERWVPICEKRFMYEMTLSLVVTPAAPGIPIPIKLQQQHRGAVPLDKHLSERTGELLSEWARGGSAPDSAAPAARPAAPVSDSQGQASAAGAEKTPSADAYIEQWNVIIAEATNAAQLGAAWKAQADLRRKIEWPDKEDLDQLIARVRVAIENLKG